MLMGVAPWVDVASDDIEGITLQQLIDVEPGVAAMAVLTAIDPDDLDAGERVAFVQAWERQHVWLCAQQQAAIAAAAGPEPLTDDDWAQDEIAAAVRLSGRAAQQRIHVARMLRGSLPATLAALEVGRISYRHALAMVDECARLDRVLVEQVEAKVLARAGEQTVSEFRRSLRRAVLALAPERAEVEHAEARAGRSVRLVPEPDGMASLIATMPATDAKAVFLAVPCTRRTGPRSARRGRRAA